MNESRWRCPTCGAVFTTGNAAKCPKCGTIFNENNKLVFDPILTDRVETAKFGISFFKWIFILFFGFIVFLMTGGIGGIIYFILVFLIRYLRKRPKKIQYFCPNCKTKFFDKQSNCPNCGIKLTYKE